jgi:hypothetical protein
MIMRMLYTPTNGGGVRLDNVDDSVAVGAYDAAGGTINWPKELGALPTGTLSVTVFVAGSITEILLLSQFDT